MKSRILMITALAALLSPAGIAFAQGAAPAPGSIHGHVQNAAGMAQGSGDVKLTTDRSGDDKSRKYEYSFPVDANGDFKGTGIKPAKYILFYVVKGITVDYLDNVEIKPGEDLAQNDDMTREEFIKNMTPEQKKQIEEFKKQNAAATQANKAVGNMNSLLTSARADEKAGKYDTAIASMQQATQLGPDQPILWLELGYAQAGGGKCDEAVTSLQKSIDLNTASKKPNPVLNGPAYDKLGECNGKLKKFPEAQAAYDKAAQADPAKAGNYYYNEAVVLYNGGSHDLAAAAADKAITADPNNANAYYLKGQSLIDKASVDPKTQKMSAPDGCLEAYLKYLELAPTGPHAADVTGIVGAFDQKQVDSFKQNRGKKK